MEKSSKIKPIYFWGIVGLIPNLGAFIGLILILLGVLKHRDKVLVFIGSFCIIWTLALDSYYYFKLLENPNMFGGGKESITRFEINELVKEIELFKVIKGRYPIHLKELDSSLKSKGDNYFLIDPYQIGVNNNNETGFFNYKPIGNKYLVFSIGEDKIANTNDDIYPDVSIDDKGGLGYIPKQ